MGLATPGFLGGMATPRGSPKIPTPVVQVSKCETKSDEVEGAIDSTPVMAPGKTTKF